MLERVGCGVRKQAAVLKSFWPGVSRFLEDFAGGLTCEVSMFNWREGAAVFLVGNEIDIESGPIDDL